MKPKRHKDHSIAKRSWLMQPDKPHIDPSFEFCPDDGLLYRGDGRTIMLRFLSLTKPNAVITDEMFYQMGKAVQIYDDSVDGESMKYDPQRIFAQSDFRPFATRYLYKFVSEDTYKNYISNGSFLLSSLERYRDMERDGDLAGDRFEGAAFCNFTAADRQLTVAALSGFDTLSFSLARDLKNAPLMQKKFGPVILQIDLAPFARELANAVEGTPKIRLIRYSDLKLYRGIIDFSEVRDYPSITPRFARAVRSAAFAPSVFAKPSRFEEEREVRIAIRMPSDVPRTRVIDNVRLLAYVKRIA